MKVVINTALIVPQILKQIASNKSMCMDIRRSHFPIEEQSAWLSAAQLMPPASSLNWGCLQPCSTNGPEQCDLRECLCKALEMSPGWHQEEC